MWPMKIKKETCKLTTGWKYKPAQKIRITPLDYLVWFQSWPDLNQVGSWVLSSRSAMTHLFSWSQKVQHFEPLCNSETKNLPYCWSLFWLHCTAFWVILYSLLHFLRIAFVESLADLAEGISEWVLSAWMHELLINCLQVVGAHLWTQTSPTWMQRFQDQESFLAQLQNLEWVWALCLSWVWHCHNQQSCCSCSSIVPYNFLCHTK